MLALFLILFAPPGGFRDDAAHEGRSTVTYGAVAWTVPTPPHASKAKQGSLTLGKDAKRLRMLWDAATGTLQLDRNDDGKFDAAEACVPTTKPSEFAVVIDGKPRTLLVRLRGDEPAFAVRGHVVGTVEIAGKSMAYLLADGNADGCFHTAGRDRLLLDLDGNGKFDALTEQFAVGDAITIVADRYLIAPNADGTLLTVRKRPTEQGAASYYLTVKSDGLVKDVRIELVSEYGELFALTELKKPTPLPVGKYRIARCEFAVELNKANVWYYRFYSPKDEFTTTIEAGKTGEYELLPALKLYSGLAKNRTPAPGETAWVESRVAAANGLTLSGMSRHAGGIEDRTAEIVALLNAPGSVKLDRNVGCLH